MPLSKLLRNSLTAMALATVLTPLAANATTMTPLDHVRIEARKAVSGPLPEVQRIADVAAMQGQTNVLSGPTNQLYPESTGG
jgi:hypothetical protein